MLLVFVLLVQVALLWCQKMYSPIFMGMIPPVLNQSVSSVYHKVVKHCLITTMDSIDTKLKQLYMCTNPEYFVCNHLYTEKNVIVDEDVLYKADFTSGCFLIISAIRQRSLYKWSKFNFQMILTSPSRDIGLNISVDIMDTYYGGKYCSTGGLGIGEYEEGSKKNRYILTCGNAVHYDPEHYLISRTLLTYVKFDGFIFAWMRGVRATFQLIDMKIPNLVKEPYTRRVDFIPGSMLIHQPFHVSPGIFLYHLFAPKIMILKLFSNSSSMESLHVLDGPGMLSPVIKDQHDFNNGSFYHLESSSFCMTIINVVKKPTSTRFLIGYVTTKRQMNKDCFKVSQNSSSHSWEGSVKVGGKVQSSNIHCAITFNENNIITPHLFTGEWEVKLSKMKHKGSNVETCRYGGLLLLNTLEDVLINLCLNTPSHSDGFVFMYKSVSLTLIYHHFLGYSSEGAAELFVRSTADICTLTWGLCEGKHTIVYNVSRFGAILEYILLK